MKLKSRRILFAALLLAAALMLTTLTALAHDWPFADVDPASPFYWNIRRIAVLNISPTGCGGGYFCPYSNVTREQMAAYMDRFTQAWTAEDEPYIISVDHRYTLNNRPAIVGNAAGGNGLEGYSYGGPNADYGVYGETNSTGLADAGVWGRNTAAGYGVKATSANSYGLYAQGGPGSGDYGGYFTGDGGILAEPTGGSAAVSATGATGMAGYFYGPANHAVYGTASGSSHYGLWGLSEHSYGVRGSTNVSGGYGLYTMQKIYAGGGCVGCTSLLIAENNGPEDLQPGDVVAAMGVAEGPSEFYARPVLLVRKADAASAQAIVGVVEGRYVSDLVSQEQVRPEGGQEAVTDEEGETSLVPRQETVTEKVMMEDAHTTTEPAGPGQRLTVVYRGLIQVRVDASAGAIAVGDLLMTSETAGRAVRASAAIEGALPGGLILGKAMEPLAEGEGLIWVLVDLQ